MQPKSIEEQEADSAKKIQRRQARANKQQQLQTPSPQEEPLYMSKFFVCDTQPRLDLVSTDWQFLLSSWSIRIDVIHLDSIALECSFVSCEVMLQVPADLKLFLLQVKATATVSLMWLIVVVPLPRLCSLCCRFGSEGIVALGVTLCVCPLSCLYHVSTARRISLGSTVSSAL